jgi:hypothetical protein
VPRQSGSRHSQVDIWTAPALADATLSPRPSSDGLPLNPGDTMSWTLDPRSVSVRAGVRLWPAQSASGLPWLLWVDLPAAGAPSPPGSPASEWPWVLGISNATTIPVSLVVNGTIVGTYAPGQGSGDGIGRSHLPPLPWLVEARSPGGHVLVSMTVHDGDIWTSTSSNGGTGFSAPGNRIDLACGRVDIWVMAEMGGPGPPSGALPSCPP